MSGDVHSGWIGVDLDGTLAYYEGFKGTDHIGVPIKPMVEKVKGWLADGKDVRIFTARQPSAAIRKWSKEHLGKILPITNRKDPQMICLYDDRAVGIERNTGKPFSPENEKQVFKK